MCTCRNRHADIERSCEELTVYTDLWSVQTLVGKLCLGIALARGGIVGPTPFLAAVSLTGIGGVADSLGIVLTDKEAS